MLWMATVYEGSFALFTASKRLFRAKRLRRRNPDVTLKVQKESRFLHFGVGDPAGTRDER